MITKIKRRKICEICSIFVYLCATDPLVVQGILLGDKFSCDFEDPATCRWTQDSSNHFNWTRHQGHTASSGTGPTTDHTEGVGLLANKNQGPGSIQHRGGKCIHINLGGHTRPADGQFLVVYQGCGEDRLEFKLYPNGTLMHTRHTMCVKPVGASITDGTEVGVFTNCDATDKWSWTAKRSLKFKNQYCLKPKTGASDPGDNVRLVLDSNCDGSQNFFKFVATYGWYLYIVTSSSRQPNDTSRLISPLTTLPSSCLHFFYQMYGPNGAKLQVYVKSGGNMGLPVWARYGDYCSKWHEAQVVVNHQKAPYQVVIEGVLDNVPYEYIAIDDIYLDTSCSAQENVSSTSTVSTLPTAEVKECTTESSSRTVIIIATSVSVGELLIIVLLLVKLKRQHQRLKMLTPIDVPLTTVETSPEMLPDYQEPKTVAGTYDDVVIGNASNDENVPAAGQGPLGVPSSGNRTSENKTPNEYEEPQGSPQYPIYTALDNTKRKNSDEDNYQKLPKQNSDNVIPAHERQEPAYEDVEPGGNLLGYAVLDQMKRETEERQHSAYQKLV